MVSEIHFTPAQQTEFVHKITSLKFCHQLSVKSYVEFYLCASYFLTADP